MKRICCAAVIGVTATALAWGANQIEFDMAPGTYVRTKPGAFPIKLKFPADPANQRILHVLTTSAFGDHATSSSILVPAGESKLTAKPEIARCGTYYVDVALMSMSGNTLTTATNTVAVIPDNRRSELTTTSPFGMGCSFAKGYSLEEQPVAIEMASIAGVACARSELRWDWCEPKKGTWDLDRFDRGIRDCMEHNIDILGLLDYWGAYHKEKNIAMSDEAVADYANYCKTMVNRYKPGGELARKLNWKPNVGVTNWELWNEPATFWFRSAEDFGKLTAAGWRACHKADPNCRAYFANAGDGFDVRAMKTMGSRTFDAISPHFYCPPRSPKEGNLFSNMKNQIRFFEQQNVHVPYWITEMGWDCDTKPHHQLTQANYLVQSYVMALGAGYERILWYCFTGYTPDKTQKFFGIVNRGDYSPKVSYAAFAGMVHMLEGAKFQEVLDLGRNISCFVFTKKGAGPLAVVWADGGTGALELGAESSVSVADMFSNAKANVASVPLSGSPHYVWAGSNADLISILRGANITGIPQVEFALQPTAGGLSEKTMLRFTAENYTTTTVDATLKASAKGLDLSMPAPAKIDGQSSSVIESAVTRIEKNSVNRYPLDAVLELSNGTCLQKQFMLNEKVAVRGTPVIDGDLSDWKQACPLYLDSPSQAVGINPWMDWNLSAQYYLMYDDSNLYFGAKVFDNMHVQPFHGGSMWEADSWQLGFDTNPAGTARDRAPEAKDAEHAAKEGNPAKEGERTVKEEEERGVYCYGLSLSDKGTETASWQGKVDEKKIKAVAKRAGRTRVGEADAETIIYEAAIPRELLKPLRMEPGQTFRFSVLLNDNDGGGRAGWMESTTGIGTGFDPKCFDVFELR